jgi:GNAT superfamily N-acetyltransferase
MGRQGQQLRWRQTEFGDLSSVGLICDGVHSELPERPEVFEEKLRLFPRGCLVLCESEEIVGYGFFYPWRRYDIPPLDTLLVRLPDPPDCIFIHDVVVLPSARGRGAARALAQRALSVGRDRGITDLALVSVYDSHTMWARVGFEVVTDSRIEEMLKSYGSSARYMIRSARTGNPPLETQRE